MSTQKKQLSSLLRLILLLVVLPFLLLAVQVVQQLLTRAGGINANIVVDTSLTLEPIVPVWNSYAQGGEESADMVAPVEAEASLLKPNYIRIDHLYDHFDVVSRGEDGRLQFDFTKLDQAVASITKTEALPALALSYMPPVISENGDITGKPRDWNEWALVVQRTIEHYSGSAGLNLPNIYYEVWNEPDLFGKWKVYGDKNYLTLYTYASLGATRAQNVNTFRIGGPATTGLYKNWVTALADHAAKNNLRLDFLSWHRYHDKPAQYAQDVSDVTDWLLRHRVYASLPRLITEWGFTSETHPGYDGNLAAAHAVAAVRQTLYGYEQLFAFELVDGRDPAGKEYWGRWGLITHPQLGKRLKPRYLSFQLLNQLVGTRLLLKGEGTWVSGIAAQEGMTTRVILTNYDPEGRHTESVPIRIVKLTNGTYSLTRTRLGSVPTKEELTITDGSFTTQVTLLPNSVILLTLTRL